MGAFSVQNVSPEERDRSFRECSSGGVAVGVCEDPTCCSLLDLSEFLLLKSSKLSGGLVRRWIGKEDEQDGEAESVDRESSWRNLES